MPLHCQTFQSQRRQKLYFYFSFLDFSISLILIRYDRPILYFCLVSVFNRHFTLFSDIATLFQLSKISTCLQKLIWKYLLHKLLCLTVDMVLIFSLSSLLIFSVDLKRCTYCIHEVSSLTFLVLLSFIVFHRKNYWPSSCHFKCLSVCVWWNF